MAGVAENEAGEEDDGVTSGESAVETRTTPEYNIAAMIVLALDTATRAGSIALVDDLRVHSRVGDERFTHGQRLPNDIIRFLGDHGRTLQEVDLFAVIIGPGSFTGLRVGVAAVQGLALAGGRSVVAVPTLDAMADAWILRGRTAEPAIVVACLDGQRGDVFFAAWEADAGVSVDQAPPVIAPSVGRPEDLRRALDACTASAPRVLVGTGGRRFADAFAGATPPIRIEDAPVPLAEVAACTAVRRPELAASPHALRPIYIRRPDAVLARERGRRASVLGPQSPVLGSGEEPGPSTEHRALRTDADLFPISFASEDDDLSAVESLQRRAFTNAWGAEAIRWELKHTDVARLYVMREPGGAVVAYCACWLLFDELHINSLAVDAPWRRRGLARRLLARVFRQSVAAGARSATLEVRQSNQAARALYESLGFHVEAVRRDYYQEPREDALILWHRHLPELLRGRL